LRKLHGTIPPAVTTQTHDDGFHEIQLNGKQLVFLFMAATVVSVVIFLCGVLVGRGVRTDRGIVTETAAAQVLTDRLPPSDASDGGRESSPPASELSYVKRLEEAQPPSEELKPASTSLVAAARPPVVDEPSNAVPVATATPPSKPVPPPSAKPEPPAKPEPAAVKTVPPPAVKPDPALTAKASAAPEPKAAAAVPTKTPAPPPGDEARMPALEGRDWTVQIAAVNERGEADAMVKRLSTKGYSAFVVAPASGTPVVFRVRVGAFKTKREAENLAGKIQKEERYKPWVTR
jgi:cell division septation protein DedD